jgi:hypothetical protein
MDILALFAAWQKTSADDNLLHQIAAALPDRAPVTPSLPSKHLARRGLQKDTAAADDTK